MSVIGKNKGRIQVTDLVHRKSIGQKISAVTCYDAAFAKLIAQTKIDLVLVGDSVGNVLLGYDSTIPVTLSDMIHHGAAVARKLQGPFLVIDMPFMSYKVSVQQGLKNCGEVLQKTGAQGVKLEGGREIIPLIEKLRDCGIPVLGHLGFTPQSIHGMGGYKVQGRTEDEQSALMEDAKALESAGAFAIVLEMIPEAIAEKVTKSVAIPTIGIGAGAICDGQILVLHDILGLNPEFKPRFVKHYETLGQKVIDALTTYHDEVQSGAFPTKEHSF